MSNNSTTQQPERVTLSDAEQRLLRPTLDGFAAGLCGPENVEEIIEHILAARLALNEAEVRRSITRQIDRDSELAPVPDRAKGLWWAVAYSRAQDIAAGTMAPGASLEA